MRQGPTLGGVRLALRTGKLVGICGEVGAGKSSLLAALLGELLPLPAPPNPDAKAGGAPRAPLVCGRLAYCSQVLWQPRLHRCMGLSKSETLGRGRFHLPHRASHGLHVPRWALHATQSGAIGNVTCVHL